MSTEDIKDSVQKQFGSVASNYTTSTVHATGPELTAMLEAAELYGDERVLDVGCGTGHTALTFAPHVAEVIGLDLTLAMLTQARKLATERGLSNISFQRGDAEQIPFPDASFDIVTSRYSAHHYPHPVAALREIARVLKPGGVFLLVDVMAPDEPLPDTFLNTIELLRDPSHVRDHAIPQWQAMLASIGLTSELIGTWPLHLGFDSWVTRMNTPILAVTQIRALIDGASREVRSALAFSDDYSFTVPIALLSARRKNEE